VTEWRERRRKQLVDGLTETRGSTRSHFLEQAMDVSSHRLWN